MKNEDCVSRQEVIKALDCEISGRIESDIDLSNYKREFQEFANIILNAQEKAIRDLPSVISASTCKNCNWWDSENHTIGYCNACKHQHWSGSWSIDIHRKTKEDFYCADFEKRGNEIDESL